MFDWGLAGLGLGVVLMMAVLTWVVSLAKTDVSIVDSVWSLFFLAVSVVYAMDQPGTGPRGAIALLLVMVWAIRLCGYLTWRNWGQEEDRRYRAIRERNQPHFGIKSLGIIFLLQAAMAWVIAWPTVVVIKSAASWQVLDTVGVITFLIGLTIETVADLQLARFKSNPAHHGAVLDSGLWRYSRHPNYFGEFVLWWGFYLMAFAAGAPAWTVVSPLLISVLLLKVSGVPLLEQTMSDRRPGYRDYIARTSAFFPRMPSRQSGQPS